MSKSALRIIRDIVIILAAIGIAITLYIRLKTPDTNLKYDIETDTGSAAHQTMGMHMGGGEELFPAGDDKVVATAVGKQVTSKELNVEANKVFRRQGMKADDEEAKDEGFQYYIKATALGTIFIDEIKMQKIKEAGLNIDALVDKKLAEWSEGFSSPEEKLKSIEGGMGVSVDAMRRLWRKDAIDELALQAVTGTAADAATEEQVKALNDWLIDKLSTLEPKFEDPKLPEYWKQFVDAVKNPPPPPHGMEGGMPPHGETPPGGAAEGEPSKEG